MQKYYLLDGYYEFRKIVLVYSLFRLGEDDYNNGYYSSAIIFLKESFRILKYEWKGEFKLDFGDLKFIPNKIGDTYEKLAFENWSKNSINNMKTSLDYFSKAKKYKEPNIISKNLKLYYYLYQAYNESDSNKRLSNLIDARGYSESGIDVDNLYKKADYISTTLKHNVNNKENIVRNLNNELNTINNEIYKSQKMIDAKKIIAKNKNQDIIALNNLANSLVLNIEGINEESEEIIKVGKNQLKDVKNNIQQKESFMKQISELEAQKKKEIEQMKNDNKKMKQKNEQLFKFLTNLSNLSN